ncbi:MAG TPA: hypothetical protein VN778_01080 [Verrucomicrobiae bacterium]|nr:hypothetical protein [Verrucomicrobiae bacterium]
MKKLLRILLISAPLVLGLGAIAHATCSPDFQTCSSGYGVNEVFMGSGGELNACSTNFCSKQSAGETAVGNTSSPSYQAQAGFNTDRTPYIQFNVNTTNINLGTITSTATQTATATFSVKAYLSHGYAVVNASDPPTNGAYTMQTMTTQGPSVVGTEQFGINLAANTSPTTFGADPVQVPSPSFATGFATTEYSLANNYKYVKGDTIAESAASTSETDYTISYIFNISNVTPGGTYNFHHVLVATATY